MACSLPQRFIVAILSLLIAPSLLFDNNFGPILGTAISIDKRATGIACSTDEDCGSTEDSPEEIIYCGPDLVCGGRGAFCVYNSNYRGFTQACLSNVCKVYSGCQSNSAAGVGQPCNDTVDCIGDTTQCALDGICGGDSAACAAYDNIGLPVLTGFSTDCVTNFCRNGACSVSPITPLGDTCIDDEDCEGTMFGLPVFCSPLGRCGGPEAECTADDGTADGYSEGCTSGQCSVRGCTTGVGPSSYVSVPGFEKRQLEKQRMFGEICSGGLVACPIGRKGYECIDITSNIESCGGCLGVDKSDGDGFKTGVDCTAVSNVDAVSCVDGRCIIGSCSDDATYDKSSNGCVISA